MRRYLLDTALVSGYLHGIPYVVTLLSPRITASEVATSWLVYAEVNEYIIRFPQYRDLHRDLRRLLITIPPYPLTVRALGRYADVRRAMRRNNQLIGDIDTLIATTALVRGLTVVTPDADFQRVPDLSVELVPRQLIRR